MKPPGYTCPAIDKVQRRIRQMAWWADKSPASVRVFSKEALALLEQVREENRQMREAYYSSRRRGVPERCPLREEHVENWAPDHLEEANGQFNLTWYRWCCLPEGHEGTCSFEEWTHAGT